jgi:hypothetical protein
VTSSNGIAAAAARCGSGGCWNKAQTFVVITWKPAGRARIAGDKILRAIARVVEEVADIKATMATKTDLADFKMEVVDLVTGEFAKFRTEHIDPMKRDIADLKQTSDKVWNAFAPRLEYDDRLRVIEQKLGIASPR